jgi:hypothetical protein
MKANGEQERMVEFPPTPTTRYELVWLLDKHWRSLDGLVASLREAELVVPLAGWSVKDHLGHLAAWQGKALAVLQGMDANEGLGVSAEQYDTLSMDALNDVIYDTWRSIPVVEVIAALHHGHARVLATVQTKPWPDLEALAPNQPPDRFDGRTVLQVVAANTYEHYMEHEVWLREQLAARQG